MANNPTTWTDPSGQSTAGSAAGAAGTAAAVSVFSLLLFTTLAAACLAFVGCGPFLIAGTLLSSTGGLLAVTGLILMVFAKIECSLDAACYAATQQIGQTITAYGSTAAAGAISWTIDGIKNAALDYPQTASTRGEGYAVSDNLSALSVYSADSQAKSDRVYVPYGKHDPTRGWGSPMDLDPETAQEVLDKGYQSGKQVYGYKDGKFYEFQPEQTESPSDEENTPEGSSDGGGAPEDPSGDENAKTQITKYHGYQIPGGKVPAEYLRQLREAGVISNAQYNRFRKQPSR